MSAAWLLLQGGGSQKRDVHTGKVEEAGVALGVGERADRRMHTVATPQQLRHQLARQESRRTGNACDRVTHHLDDAVVTRHFRALGSSANKARFRAVRVAANGPV